MSKPHGAMLNTPGSLGRRFSVGPQAHRLMIVVIFIVAGLLMLGGAAAVIGKSDHRVYWFATVSWESLEVVGGLSLLFNGALLATAALVHIHVAGRSRGTQQVLPGTRQMDESVQRNEERYRMLVHAMTTFFGVGDVTGGISKFQEGWHRYTGQAWEEQQGYGWARAIHPEDRQRILHLWEEAVRSSCGTRVEYRLWHAASQSYRFCESTAVPLLNPDGSVREWFAAVRDIDDQVNRVVRSLPEAMPYPRSAKTPASSPGVCLQSPYASSEGIGGATEAVSEAVSPAL